MARHIELGKEGEKLAREWLINNGFSVLYRNWRDGHVEIDIIAIKNGIPHFIEVKLRSTIHFGFPEESVTRKKMKNLLQAVDTFMFRHPDFHDFRIDILSINFRKARETQFYFIEDVYL